MSQTRKTSVALTLSTIAMSLWFAVPVASADPGALDGITGGAAPGGNPAAALRADPATNEVEPADTTTSYVLTVNVYLRHNRFWAQRAGH